MKKILIILFCFLRLTASATTYYIDEAGLDDAGEDGSISEPWATLAYACTRATSTGDIIYINAGTYTETVQSVLAVGVSIVGEGETSIISSTISSGYSATILLHSSSEGTDGDQSISYIAMDGGNVAWGAILINARSNVHIHNCYFDNFTDCGVTFNGRTGWSSSPPSIWATGNKFYSNIMNNCAKSIGPDASDGGLRIGGQSGMFVYDNTITQNTRAGQNGFPIKYYANGHNINLKIYDNTITGPSDAGVSGYGFAIELWYTKGGLEIYNNRIIGSIDLAQVTDEDQEFGAKIYNNEIGYESLQATQEVGIYLEQEIEYVYIYYNLIKNIACGIRKTKFGDATNTNYVYVYYNIFSNLGQTGTDYQTWGIHFAGDRVSTGTNMFIYNNIFKASTVSGKETMTGINLPNIGDFTNCEIKNNIILNFDYAPIETSGNYEFDMLNILNNIMYGNGNSNDPLWNGGFSPTNYNNSDNQKTDPLFVGGSPYDYYLQAESPAIDTGLDVGLTEDYLGNIIPYNGIPDIGVYEYGFFVPPSPTYNNSIVTHEGKILFSNGKVLVIN